MILEKFSKEEASSKSMQQKVSFNTQKRATKKGKAVPTVSASELSPPIKQVKFDEEQSPNSMSSVTEDDDSKPKKH